MSRGWVHQLPIDQLKEELRKHHVDDEGSKSELRFRLVALIRQHKADSRERSPQTPPANEPLGATGNPFAFPATSATTQPKTAVLQHPIEYHRHLPQTLRLNQPANNDANRVTENNAENSSTTSETGPENDGTNTSTHRETALQTDDESLIAAVNLTSLFEVKPQTDEKTTTKTSVEDVQPITPKRAKMGENKPIWEIVSKWNLHFNGKTDPISFMERLDEMRTNAGVSEDDLLTALPWLLRDQTLLWYRNNKDMWATWDEFCDDFRENYMPADHQAKLQETIINRKQKPDERGREYVEEIRTMMRRHGGFKPTEMLDRVYENLLPTYRQYIRKRDFTTLRELLHEIDDCEKLHRELKPARHQRISEISPVCREPDTTFSNNSRRQETDRKSVV